MAAETDFLADHAAVRGGKLALVDLERDRRWTYAELDARAWRVASLIEQRCAAMGRPAHGERVAALGRNSADVVAIYLGCLRAGAVFQPLNWRLAPPELAALGKDGDPAILVYEREFAAGAFELARACPGLILLSLDDPDSENLETALSLAPPRPDKARAAGENEPSTLLYTSGTTGVSKGVIVTEANARATAVNYSRAAKVDEASVFLCDMPMFHVVGLFAVTRTTLQQGGTLLVSARFDAEETVRRIGDPSLGVTHYFCVPQMAQLMLQAPSFDAAPFRRLVVLQTGGAPLAVASARAWLDQGVMLIDGYGMSEAGTVLGMPPGDIDLLKRKAGAAGLPAVLTELRIVDRDGVDVATGETGEIWLRGPSVSPGYWRNPAATAAARCGEWFRTGDAARCDEDGFVTLVDRWKDMFISGGENVYPAEVEAAMLELAGVAEAAVIGVPDARWGESGAAFVVLAAGASLKPEDVVGHCRARLAAYKVPKHVRIVSQLPRTASGKVQKAILRARWIDNQEMSS